MRTNYYSIIGGHFNLVLNLEKDKKGGLPKTHKKAAQVVSEIVEKLALTDIWRVQNPDIERFTWRQKNPIHCRLDFS